VAAWINKPDMLGAITAALHGQPTPSLLPAGP
jgi:hypothetical protein